ncbi:MAG: glycosyltransferase [Saprospiraceae bacterium]|nr:glycosyltransferase [Saprospiraceae bacterium]
MQRICASLVADGHVVCLVGRQMSGSAALKDMPFQQFRLKCRWNKGPLFYLEYNFRLFRYLMKIQYDAVCSVDLDTLPAGCAATLMRRKKRVFDAHEYFTEVPEVVDRPVVRWVWSKVADWCLPFYRYAYTVGPGLAGIFTQKYGISFGVVRNTPTYQSQRVIAEKAQPLMLLYQGALNEGRGIEALLAALKKVDDVQLILAGEGDLSAQLRILAQQPELLDKVRFLGFVTPEDLKKLTPKAWVGVNLLEKRGLSYYYSLANKFFDYIQAEAPVLTMQFPEYQALNQEFEVARLVPDLNPEGIIHAIESLKDPAEYERLRQNCARARQQWHWAIDEQVLLQTWRDVSVSD